MNLYCKEQKVPNDKYREGWERVWGEEQEEETEDPLRKQKDEQDINDYTEPQKYPQEVRGENNGTHTKGLG